MNPYTLKTLVITSAEVLMAIIYLNNPGNLLPIALIVDALFIYFVFEDIIAGTITEFFAKNNTDVKQHELFLDHLITVANNLENTHLEFEKKDEKMLITYVCKGEEKVFGYDFCYEEYIWERPAGSERDFKRLLRFLGDEFVEGYEEEDEECQ